MNNNILPLLNSLIKIPSVSSDIEKLHEIVDFVEKEFDGYKNAIIMRYEWNQKPTIVIQNFEGKQADIILNGHLDVVPASEEGQFEPVEKDGKLYARGSGDMKAGDAIMIELMKEIFDTNFTDKKVSLILTTDEEIGGEDGAKKIAEIGYSASEGVLVPDSGASGEITIAEKGIFDIQVEVRGKSGHASRPWLSDNAVDKTYLLYKALRKYIQDDEKLFAEENWGSSVNLTKIEAGSVTNVIPDKVEAYFDVRITEEFSDTRKFMEEMRKICKDHDTEIVSFFQGDLVYTDPNHEFVQKYLNVCTEVLGYTPKILREHGASDGRYFASRGMPLILQRPTCENIHTHGEYVELESIDKIYQIYKKFIFGDS